MSARSFAADITSAAERVLSLPEPHSTAEPHLRYLRPIQADQDPLASGPSLRLLPPTQPCNAEPLRPLRAAGHPRPADTPMARACARRAAYPADQSTCV